MEGQLFVSVRSNGNQCCIILLDQLGLRLTVIRALSHLFLHMLWFQTGDSCIFFSNLHVDLSSCRGFCGRTGVWSAATARLLPKLPLCLWGRECRDKITASQLGDKTRRGRRGILKTLRVFIFVGKRVQKTGDTYSAECYYTTHSFVFQKGIWNWTSFVFGWLRQNYKAGYRNREKANHAALSQRINSEWGNMLIQVDIYHLILWDPWDWMWFVFEKSVFRMLSGSYQWHLPQRHHHNMGTQKLANTR